MPPSSGNSPKWPTQRGQGETNVLGLLENTATRVWIYKKGHCSKREAPDCAHSRTESAVYPCMLPALLETNKGKILAKKINVHIEDVQHSRSWDSFLKNVWRKKIEAQSQWDFPGSSLFKTLLFYCRGFDSWLSNENPACCPMQPKILKLFFKICQQILGLVRCFFFFFKTIRKDHFSGRNPNSLIYV